MQTRCSLIRSPSSCLRLVPILICAGGCAPAYRNAPLEVYAPDSGYRFETLKCGEGNSDELFVCVTFSGGGSRAAALAYGVLQELRDTSIPPLERQGTLRSMLDEVDTISSVSGGSFTAAGYALWRERLFDGHYEQVFLKKNVQQALALRIFSFPSLLLLPLVVLDRIDVASEYFHEEIFERRTYADLLQDGRRPYIVVNATNLAAGQRFEFSQADFDILGSDLACLPIGYAVGASQAVPIVFSPLRLKYYPGRPSSQAIADVFARKRPRSRVRRREVWARSLLPSTQPGQEPPTQIEAERHRWLYLVDGASSDNLGLSFVIENHRDGVIRDRIERDAQSRIRQLVVIVVNAGTRPPNNIEQRHSAPGLLSMGYRAAMIAIDNHSHALIDMVWSGLVEQAERIRSLYSHCRSELAKCPDAAAPDAPFEARFSSFVVEVNLEDLSDDQARKELQALPTNYNLQPEQVDRVIQAGRQLIRDNSEFQRLLSHLRSAPR
jgi:predicted acylesterase/phospholipase RssA